MVTKTKPPLKHNLIPDKLAQFLAVEIVTLISNQVQGQLEALQTSRRVGVFLTNKTGQ